MPSQPSVLRLGNGNSPNSVPSERLIYIKHIREYCPSFQNHTNQVLSGCNARHYQHQQRASPQIRWHKTMHHSRLRSAAMCLDLLNFVLYDTKAPYFLSRGIQILGMLSSTHRIRPNSNLLHYGTSSTILTGIHTCASKNKVDWEFRKHQCVVATILMICKDTNTILYMFQQVRVFCIWEECLTQYDITFCKKCRRNVTRQA